MAKLFGIALNFMAQTVARANCLRRLEKGDRERGVGCSDNLAAAFKIICLLIKYVFQFLSAALLPRCCCAAFGGSASRRVLLNN